MFAPWLAPPMLKPPYRPVYGRRAAAVTYRVTACPQNAVGGDRKAERSVSQRVSRHNRAVRVERQMFASAALSYGRTGKRKGAL